MRKLRFLRMTVALLKNDSAEPVSVIRVYGISVAMRHFLVQNAYTLPNEPLYSVEENV
jgi:hypothetical protein